LMLSLSDRLKSWQLIERRLSAASAADLVVVLYNPASRSRTTQVAAARELLLRHRSASVPVVVGREVGRPGEALQVTTLGELDPASVDMRCLVIIGSSATSQVGDRVWTRRSMP
ncbi:MAG TPA: SAM-dependent methyltransferase, partial [Microlunatus sp.]|nr:SAM-dependent methyltransferase [Microlunatus sp.]